MRNFAYLLVITAFFAGCLRQQRHSDLTDLVNYETYRGTIKHSEPAAPAPLHLVLESLPGPGDELFLNLDNTLSFDEVKLLADAGSYIEIFGYLSPSPSGLFEVKKIRAVEHTLTNVVGTFSKNTTAFDPVPYMITDGNGVSYKVLPESKALNDTAKKAAAASESMMIEGYFDAQVSDILIAVRMVENQR